MQDKYKVFDIPTDNLVSGPVFIKDIKERNIDAPIVVVSPDVGELSETGAKRINANLAIIDKEEKSRRV